MDTGKLGEKIAGDYLLKKGFKIICNNYRCKYGEVDIICENEKYIVFVEVKSKQFFSTSATLDKIDHNKRTKIINTIKSYQLDNNLEKQIRIDVIEVIIYGKYSMVSHIENAFGE